MSNSELQQRKQKAIARGEGNSFTAVSYTHLTLPTKRIV